MKSSLSILSLSLASMLVAACAADPAKPTDANAQAAATPTMVCGREYATGSNIATTKCRTTEQAEAEKAAAAQSLGRSTGGANVKPGGG